MAGQKQRSLGTSSLDEEGNAPTDTRVVEPLEAVGALAAGIAHEINTPIQFVGDSVHFLREAFDDLRQLVRDYRFVLNAVLDPERDSSLLGRIRDADIAADLDYLDEEVPGAFERTIEGISRVATIVRAMKEFSHPDQSDKSPGDINQGIRNTLIVARNEYKGVATLETDLGELPMVSCYLGELNQVFLNLIINASHAIEEMQGGTGQRGVIRVSTRALEDWIEIRISDTGPGIPQNIRDRIYDPFFTTKGVGKGTGQGLAIARKVVVERHGGTIGIVDEGPGTCFVVCLPTTASKSETPIERAAG